MRTSYTFLYNRLIMNDHKLLKQVRKYFCEVEFIHCKVLGVPIYFNSKGFHHLLRKFGILRSRHDRTGRLSIFVEFIDSIATQNFDIKYRYVHKKNSIGKFIALEKKFGKRKIKIILRQINNGRIHFFSIMEYTTSLK